MTEGFQTPRTLLDLNVGRFDDGPPLLDLSLVISEQPFRRLLFARRNLMADFGVTPLDRRIAQGGFNTIARARDVLGPYLGLVAGVKKSWAEANRDLLVRFIRAYAKGVEAMY